MLDNILKKLEVELDSKGVMPSLFNGAMREQGKGALIKKFSPVDGREVGAFYSLKRSQYDQLLEDKKRSFLALRRIPAPARGEWVRLIGEEVRKHKEDLAHLITLEAGKIRQESLGEVQEWIDICDFAVGLSRQLHGLTIVSERPFHRMMEQWHPLGVTGVISAFNFPMAVWAWNSMLALVCGDPVLWKPSEKTPLCALACQAVINKARAKAKTSFPVASSSVVLGGRELGEWMSEDGRIPLVSATGSITMGKQVAQKVGARLGKALLELGGNNALIVSKRASLELSVRAIVFSAVGTAGQRCTSLRRLIVHESISKHLLKEVLRAYQTLKIGNPFEEKNSVGPLIDKNSFDVMQEAILIAKKQGGNLIHGGETVDVGLEGYYVTPAIIEISPQAEIIKQETFAPILFWMEFSEWEQAIEIHNRVPQGLSSAVFTDDVREAEWFLSPWGSDCGIANVNIGTSGAEIGGAFGGEKDTGGGRESGSDAWKNYMRRVTNTINYGRELPLAQGIRFD